MHNLQQIIRKTQCLNKVLRFKVKMAIEYTSASEASEYYLTPKEINQMINAADTLRNRLVIELLFECGIRRFELRGIEIKHADLPKRDIYIWRGKRGDLKGKNDKARRARHVFVKEERILTDLKAYIGSRTTGKLIQSNNKATDGIDLSGINRIVAKVAKLAGMKCPNPNRKNVHPHMLRHSFGRREDIDLASKQKIMGHSNFRITADFYGKVSTPESKKRFMRSPSPLQKQSPGDQSVTQDEDNPLKILQLRFAKGEISQTEYLEMKKLLSS